MAKGLHLVSCYLPNDPFVDRFFHELSSALSTHGQQMLLLPTYQPDDDLLQHVRISYTLTGYKHLIDRRVDSTFGLLPHAVVDSEFEWLGRRFDGDAIEGAIARCAAFFGRMLDEMEPDSVSVWNPSVPQGRLLQLASLARGIPCYAIERGVFAETIMIDAREIGAQSDIVVNPSLRSALLGAPLNRARLQQVRAYYEKRDFSRYAAECASSPPELRDELGIPAGARIVVLMLSLAAANWRPRSMPGMRFNSPWFETAQQAVDALTDALPEDTWLIVQGHPLDEGRWSLRPHERLRHVKRLHLKTLFGTADVLAFLGATTTQHEALLASKPLLLMSRSQLSGLNVAYEYRGSALGALLQSALRHERRAEHFEGRARYVPFLFDHVLYGCSGSPARKGASDLAAHLAALEAAHDASADQRIEAWLAAAAADLAPALQRA